MIETVKQMLTSLWERMRYGARPDASARSPHWHIVEREHIRREPVCQHCGRGDFLEAHHIEGFEENPALELFDGKDDSGKDGNLITLCRPPGSLFGSKAYPLGSCHFRYGHKDPTRSGPNWKTYNHAIRMECNSIQAARAAEYFDTNDFLKPTPNHLLP